VRESLGGRQVLDRDSGVLADLRPADATVQRDLRRHLARAVVVLNAVYAETMRRRGYVLFHGAAVARAGRAMLIVGPSGVGKSSTALRMLERGCEFLADDNVLARASDEGVRIVGGPRWPRVFPDTLLRQPRLATLLEPAERAALLASSVAPAWRKRRVIDLAAVYGPGCRVPEATLTAVMRLAWRSGGGATLIRRRGRIAALAHAARFDSSLGVLDLSRPALRRPPRLLRGLYRIPRGARSMRLLAPVPLLSITGGIDSETLDSTIESLLPTS
jgi:HprK-related kinase B